MNTRYPDYTLDTDRASRENGSTAYIALDNSTYVIEQTATKTLSSFPESLVSDTPVSYAHQPSSYAYGVKAITPVIRYAWDDVGQEQGVRASGNRTDDAAPTLRGSGPANTYMDIMFTNGSVTRYNGITTDADGNWSWTPRADLADGTWTFKVQADGQDTWSNAFKLVIDTPAAPDALITHIYDNVGSEQGERFSGSITDDAMPTLHGTGPANKLIDILYTDGGRVRTNSTFTDNEGNWSWTPWQNLNDGYWTFQVQVEGAPSWSQSFAITIDTSTDTASGDDAFGSGFMSLSFGDLLSVVDSDVLIDKGKTQYMLDNDASNEVQLQDILPAESDISEWQHQQGTVTVAGVEYEVYSHGDDAELLVQQGVKTELI